MSSSESLKVGLKLLGAYFVIVGLSDVGYGLWHLIDVRADDGEFISRFIRYESHASLIASVVKVVGGIALLVGASVWCKPHKQGIDDQSNTW